MRLTLVHRPGHPRANERGMVDARDLSAEEARLARDGPSRVAVVGDSHYDGVRSPVDGSDIGSRRKRRDHMRRHGLADFDDFKGIWEKEAKVREAEFQPGNRERREDVERAIHELETGKTKASPRSDAEVRGPDAEGRDAVAMPEGGFTAAAEAVLEEQKGV
jgi:hypothetical protein